MLTLTPVAVTVRCTLAYAILAVASASGFAAEANRGLRPAQEPGDDFNQGWRFHRGDVEGASGRGFDDSAWRLVDLPHDIAVEDLEVQNDRQVGPFSKDTKDGPSVGYLRGGVAWYRKQLAPAPADGVQVTYLSFDGVQSESTVFVNGKQVGEHVYGYTPFYFNITDYLSADGEPDEIAIRVENPEQNSRWFPGFGIYRDVSLARRSPVHVAPWGTYITTPRIADGSADVVIAADIKNTTAVEAEVTLHVDLIDPAEATAESIEQQVTLAPNAVSTVDATASLKAVDLWDVDSPNLYTARLRVVQDGAVVDARRERFGIRSIEFSAEQGFLLNGKPVLLKGACLHHDNGILGAAAFRAAEFRRVRVMKENGFNAIRCSHNPPSSHFLDACDELGMLVIDEAFDMWERPKRRNDYHVHFPDWWKRDLRAMLLRDRNHPSIIMWSYGNEVQERCHPRGLEIAQELAAEIHSLDSSRPTTQALCGFWDNRGMNWERDTPAAFEIMDVAGYNYKPEKYESDHQSFPDRVMYGSESYPMQAWEYWRHVRQHPYIIGDFVWTGMDYIGESGIGISTITRRKRNLNHPQRWPWFNANCGDIDLIGNKKPQSYYRDVVWGESNLEVLVHEHIPEGFFEQSHGWGWPLERPHWNWEGNEGDVLSVNVYSSYPTVRLELNGEVIGEQQIDQAKGITATFKVPYAPGVLTATGLRDGEQESKTLATTGKPTSLRLAAEQSLASADRNEVVFLSVWATDNEGRLTPTASLKTSVNVSGAAELLAAGNGYPRIEGGFQDKQFRLDRGRGLIVIRPTGEAGEIQVEVTSENGGASSVQLKAVR